MKRSIPILLAIVWMLAGWAGAQNANQKVALKDDSYIVMDLEQFKKIAEWDEAGRNQFVIPWNDVKDLIGIEIQNVNAAQLKLPWQEFKTLLEWSIENAGKDEEGAPAPVPYLITSSEYKSDALTEDGATFTATLKIDVLEKEGWKRIPVLMGDVAVQKTELPEGVYFHLENNQYILLTEKSGPVEATIEFTVPVNASGGAYSLQFQKVPSGTSLLDVTVPDKDVDVVVGGAQVKVAEQVDGKTRVLAALPSVAQVSVTWERAIPEAEKVPPKLYSENRTLVSIADGILLGRGQIAFNILHTATRQFELNVPEGVSILSVTASNVRDWRVADQKLTVQLEREVIGSTRRFEILLVELAQFVPAEGGHRIPSPARKIGEHLHALPLNV
ncbi:MAG: hypothetical protein AAF492_23395, partial [Verrucomicrobiota bacterium]